MAMCLLFTLMILVIPRAMGIVYNNCFDDMHTSTWYIKYKVWRLLYICQTINVILAEGLSSQVWVDDRREQLLSSNYNDPAVDTHSLLCRRHRRRRCNNYC